MAGDADFLRHQLIQISQKATAAGHHNPPFNNVAGKFRWHLFLKHF